MKKRILSILIALCMVIGLFPATAVAAFTVTPAEITSVTVTVDGVEYTSGDTVTITPDTTSLIYTVSGTNFDNLSYELNYLIHRPDHCISIAPNYYWIIDTENNTATLDKSAELYHFANYTSAFVPMFSNTGLDYDNFVSSGISIYYDDGTPKITDVTVTVDGTEYTSGETAYITDQTTSLIYTVSGTNFKNLSPELNHLIYAPGQSTAVAPGYGWSIDTENNAATLDVSDELSHFIGMTSEFTPRYSNIGSGNDDYVSSDISICYNDGIPKITGITVTVDGTEYASGDTVAITSSTTSLLYTLSGINFANLSDEDTYFLEFCDGICLPLLNDSHWDIDTENNTAIHDASTNLFFFESMEGFFEPQYSNTGTSEEDYIPSGIFLYYDDGTAKIKDISLTVDGTEHFNDNGYIVLDEGVSELYFTLYGVNFENLSEHAYFSYQPDNYLPITVNHGFVFNAENNTATLDVINYIGGLITLTDSYEVRYSLTGDDADLCYTELYLSNWTIEGSSGGGTESISGYAWYGESASDLYTLGTLSEAIDAVNNGSASYILLDSSAYIQELCLENDVTIDLNGFNFLDASAGASLDIADGVTVTLTDSSGSSSNDFFLYGSIHLHEGASLYAENIQFLAHNVYADHAILDLSHAVSAQFTYMHTDEEPIIIGGDSLKVPASVKAAIYDGEADLYTEVTVLNADTDYIINAYYTVTVAIGGDATVSLLYPNSFTFTPSLDPSASAPEGGYFLGWTLDPSDPFANRGTYFTIVADITIYPIWGAPVYVGGVPLRDGQYLASDASEPTENLPEGGYAYYKDNVLTLNNFTTKDGIGYCHAYDDESAITDSALIYAADKISIRLIGENMLSASRTASNLYTRGIKSLEDLTILGDGSLTLFDVFYGICSDKDVTFASGNITIRSLDDAISAENNANIDHATLNLTSADDEGIDVIGNITVNGGTLTVYAEDNGLMAEESILINGGTITVYANDDAIDAMIDVTVTGGSLTIRADESAIVASGDVLISGGTILATTNASSAIGAENDITVTGGRMLLSSYEYSLYADNLLSISGKNTVIYGNVPVGATTVGFTLGEVSEYGTEYGLTVFEGVDVTHTFATTYAKDEYSHWHPCTDADCLLPASGLLHRALNTKGAGFDSHSKTDDPCGSAAPDPSRNAILTLVGVGMENGDYLSNDGTLSKTRPENGGYAYLNNFTLTLSGFVYEGKGETDTALYLTSTRLTLHLIGENRLSISEGWLATSGIHLDDSTLEISGKGSLLIETDMGVEIHSSSVYVANDNLTVLARRAGVNLEEGYLDVARDVNLSITSNGYGIHSDIDSILNLSGTLDITADFDGIKGESSMYIDSTAHLEITSGAHVTDSTFIYMPDSFSVEGALYRGDYFEASNGIASNYIRVIPLSEKISESASDLQAEMNKDISSAKDEISSEISGAVSEAKGQISSEISGAVSEAKGQISESVNEAIGSTKQEITAGYEQAITNAASATEQKLSESFAESLEGAIEDAVDTTTQKLTEGYEKAIADAVIAAEKKLSDGYTGSVSEAVLGLSTQNSELNDKLASTNLTVIIIAIVAGAGLLLNLALIAYIIIGKKKVIYAPAPAPSPAPIPETVAEEAPKADAEDEESF